jgi:hypothetical protein
MIDMITEFAKYKHFLPQISEWIKNVSVKKFGAVTVTCSQLSLKDIYQLNNKNYFANIHLKFI